LVFSSFGFCLVFLPCVLAGAFIAQKFGDTAIKLWIIGASLIFYTAWYPPYIFILLGSIVVNFGLLQLALSQSAGSYRRFCTITAGVVTNICLLGWFKYAGFLAFDINALFHTDLVIPHFVLPLGISFFTFQKIALLVDVYRREVKHVPVLSYLLFVTFFPQLIAGPIVLFPEVQNQYQQQGVVKVTWQHFTLGISIFAVGLLKKTMFADLAATFTTPVFDAAANGTSLHTSEAWSGVVAYTLQIYFDFSGYSDMAVGSAAMFGVVLPFNFASPYQATSIIEFWRRWHITLSRFLRVYLYIPLGGNRKGSYRRYVNLMLVMLIGGLWHGAAWTFVAWGALHGVYLVVNHLWRSYSKTLPAPAPTRIPWLRIGSWFVTFFSVMLAWIFFRADTFQAAGVLLGKMFELSGLAEMIRHGLPDTGVYGAVAFAQTNVANTSYIPRLLVIGLAICFFMPNTQQIFHGWIERWLMPNSEESPWRPGIIEWNPSMAWGVIIGITIAVSLMAMTEGTSPFLYFNF
jgi:alginate O-acetyltransferase complex protein AlgI